MCVRCRPDDPLPNPNSFCGEGRGERRLSFNQVDQVDQTKPPA